MNLIHIDIEVINYPRSGTESGGIFFIFLYTYGVFYVRYAGEYWVTCYRILPYTFC